LLFCSYSLYASGLTLVETKMDGESLERKLFGMTVAR
jgi:hypothetical protein